MACDNDIFKANCLYVGVPFVNFFIKQANSHARTFLFSYSDFLVSGVAHRCKENYVGVAYILVRFLDGHCT
jgi:hypothetical protein